MLLLQTQLFSHSGCTYSVFHRLMVLDITVLDIASAFFSVLLAPRIKINSQLSAWVLHWAWSSENHLMVLSRKEIWTDNWQTRFSAKWRVQWWWGNWYKGPTGPPYSGYEWMLLSYACAFGFHMQVLKGFRK